MLRGPLSRRRFVEGSAAVAAGLAVAGGRGRGRAQVASGPGGVPDVAFDDTRESELLVNPRDIPTSRWHDGDVVQAYSTEDALRVHAEVLASGRGSYRGEGVAELGALYDEITHQRRLTPSYESLLWWWEHATKLTSLLAQDHMYYPFSELERRKLLVLPLSADITPALRQTWEDAEGLKRWKLHVDWRSTVVAGGLTTAAAVLDRAHAVAIDHFLPISIVTAEPVLVPVEEL